MEKRNTVLEFHFASCTDHCSIKEQEYLSQMGSYTDEPHLPLISIAQSSPGLTTAIPVIVSDSARNATREKRWRKQEKRDLKGSQYLSGTTAAAD